MKRFILAAAAFVLAMSAGRAKADLILTTPPDLTVVEGTNFSLTFTVLNNGPDQLVNQQIVGRFESGLLLSNPSGLEVGFGPGALSFFPATIDAGATATLTLSLVASILTSPTTISTGNLLTASFYYDDPNMTDKEFSAIGKVNITVKAVPEPASLSLMGIGGLGLLGYVRRRGGRDQTKSS